MDSTHTAGRRRPEHELVGRPCVELTDGQQSHPPIYAQLVAEWRAKGRGIPERRELFEVLWASFSAGPLEAELWPVDPWADRRPAEAPTPPSNTGTERDRSDEQPLPVPAVPVPRGLPGW
jgi:hypothetical protein